MATRKDSIQYKPTLFLRIKSFFKTNPVIQWLLEIDIDWFFIFLFSYISLNLFPWQRLLISIGISYIYKVIVKDVITIFRVHR